MALQFSLLTLSQHLEAFRESFRKAPRQNTFSLADAGIQFSSIRCLDVHEQRTKFSRPARVCGKIKEKKINQMKTFKFVAKQFVFENSEKASKTVA